MPVGLLMHGYTLTNTNSHLHCLIPSLAITQ